MYKTISNAKDAINRINKVYPILEEIFDGHTNMTRKEIMATYSSKEKVKKQCRHYTRTVRVLPCFEVLRHLGLLVVVKEEENRTYLIERSYQRQTISPSVYESLPEIFQEMCEENSFRRYYYELTPKEIAIEKIIETVHNNFESLMELAN